MQLALQVLATVPTASNRTWWESPHTDGETIGQSLESTNPPNLHLSWNDFLVT